MCDCGVLSAFVCVCVTQVSECVCVCVFGGEAGECEDMSESVGNLISLVPLQWAKVSSMSFVCTVDVL